MAGAFFKCAALPLCPVMAFIRSCALLRYNALENPLCILKWIGADLMEKAIHGLNEFGLSPNVFLQA